jgi:hypothetical protein
MLSACGAVCSRRVVLIRSARRSLSSNPKKFYDPQAEAMQRMNENIGKLSGIEAVNALPASIHRANYATAACLIGFVGYVFWYSMTAVGQVTSEVDALSSLQEEATDARALKAKRDAQDRTAEELADLDMGLSEKDLEKEGIILAVAAPDEIATQEEDRNVAVLKGGEGPKRSLVNRIVFFWR